MAKYKRVADSKALILFIFLYVFINNLLANPIDRSASGLEEFTSVVDFSEMRIVDSSIVTDQFSQYGVTFIPNLFYRTADHPDWASVSGPNLRTGDPEVNPFSIRFNEAHLSAAVVLIAQPATPATITAKLGGVDVESFETIISIDNPNQYFGFEDILFDEIEVSYSGATRLRVDNVQFGESVILSPLRITNIINVTSEDIKSVEIFWNSRPGRIYAVYVSDDFSEWTELDDNVASEGEETSFIDDALSDKDKKKFYMVEDITN
jgi:hypothetical protein